MIIGLFLRYFKTYSGINYVPISNGEKFNGLVGNNGIGKSSILEALDFLFNAKEFNYHSSVIRRGQDKTNPYIVPIFLIKKDQGIISPNNSSMAQKYSDFVWEIDENDVFTQNKDHIRSLIVQREILERNDFKDAYYLLPIGLDHNRNVDLSIFNIETLDQLFDNQEKSGASKKHDVKIVNEHFLPLLENIINYYEFIYIPNDIDPSTFTNLENNHIQSLMGKPLVEEIEKCVPKKDIKKINDNLSDFLKKLEKVMVDYAFRTPSIRQQMIRKANVYNMIIDDFFKTRKLHMKADTGNWLEVGLLSSGEKQKAIIDLTENFLKEYRGSAENVILAIDEPESSLHMSACYSQFDALYNISESTTQLLFCTHWYGFIPTISNGNVCVITKSSENKHKFDLVSSGSYREEVKQSKEATKGEIPYDIRLKSINDLIQSIVTSLLCEEPFNWIVCEGSSEKIYFEKFFKDEIANKKLRLLPVGGAPEVKKIYENLIVTYSEFKDEIKGKVFLLIDTDTKVVEFKTHNKNHANIQCKRIVNDINSKDTILVNVHNNQKSPKTEIEDSLNGKIFLQAMNDFSNEYPQVKSLLDRIDTTKSIGNSSYFYLDLKTSEQSDLDDIFNIEGFKFAFAKKYCELMEKTNEEPDWIKEIKTYFNK